MCKWQLDVHNLNQFIAELKRTSSTSSASSSLSLAVSSSSVFDSAAELNARWNKLTVDADEREVGNMAFVSE